MSLKWATRAKQVTNDVKRHRGLLCRYAEVLIGSSACVLWTASAASDPKPPPENPCPQPVLRNADSKEVARLKQAGILILHVLYQ